MDALAGILALGLIVGFIIWLASKSSAPVGGGTRSVAPGLPEPTAWELRSRAAGIEFLLKEARESDAWADMPASYRSELMARYEKELADIRAELVRPYAAAPAYGSETPSAVFEAAATVAKTAPTRPEPKPRQPRDWSWLAEQQASLFLFAGAFLVVVAALIYVGYSGQALSGALKVALLAGYTLAFLAAGVVCFRIPVVRVAGLVFIGVSAVLVPLNFVLAGSVIEADFSDEGMWLAGSLVSAAFYASVGGLGLGRQYSFAAGTALASAAGAAVFVLGLPVEWAPAPFLALAVIMAAAEVASPETFRRRVANIWVGQAHLIAVVFLCFALASAIILNQDGEDLSTRWFAAPLAVFGITFYAIQALRGSSIAVTGVAIALAGLTSSIVYGFDLSPEYYAFALAGAGLVLVVAVRSPLSRIAAGMLYPKAATDALVLAHVATGGGIVVAIIATVFDADPDSPYSLETSWFLLGAFALAALVYATHISMPMPALGDADPLATYSFALALGGMAAAVVYGADWSPEYYAFAAAAAAAILLGLATWGLPKFVGEGPPEMRRDWLGLSHVAAAVAAAVAGGAVYAAERPEATFVLETLWSVPALFGALAAFYVLAVLSPFRPAQGWGIVGGLGMAVSVFGVAGGVVYALDVSEEYYAFAAAAAAAVLLALATWDLPSAAGENPPEMRRNWLLLAHIAAATAAAVAIGAVYASEIPEATYATETLWFLPALFGALLAFYGLALWSPFRPSRDWQVMAGLGLVASVFGITTGIVYALEVSEEYYAFAALGPAVVLGVVAHLAPVDRVDSLLPSGWRAGAIGCGRIAAVAGVSVAVIAALVTTDPDVAYEPETHAFLPLALLAAAVFFALDASRGKEWGPSAALLATLGGAGVTIAYGFEADAEYYGVALAGVGLAYGFVGLIWSPSWLDERARDQSAVLAVTLAWLPFEGVYEDHLRIGAGVHFAAAVLYTGAALVDRSKLTLGQLLNATQPIPVRVGTGWMYAAGLTIVVGYVDILRSLPSAEGEGSGSLALPLMALSLGFLVAGALFRWVRAELRIHVYIVALLTAILSLSISKDAVTLASILSVFVFAYAAIAAWENSPLLAAPAAVFGFAAVIAWRQELDWPLYAVPLAYSAIALALYSAGFAVRGRLRAWGDALRAAGATFAVASPGIGFGILASETEAGFYNGQEFETSALYEWSTLATGLTGLLALAESSIARRGWVVVAGSAVMLVAVLLQIGRFQPENIQAYTAVIGAYLVLIGLIGLSRYRLIPGLDETAVYIEALGAVIVMFPSFIQSIEGGWRYEVILLIEAAGFFTAGVVLQRRGLLGTSLGGLVLVGGRVLFDALNALPNWIVALIIGMALLATGLGIMIGRDRWTQWEERIASWWKEPPGGKDQQPPRLRPGAPGA